MLKCPCILEFPKILSNKNVQEWIQTAVCRGQTVCDDCSFTCCYYVSTRAPGSICAQIPFCLQKDGPCHMVGQKTGQEDDKHNDGEVSWVETFLGKEV
ncbi:hypothetical protein AALO_G00200010 [Alosa alosa]|uniref:Uncharacterized protein n=1 Tax=Alosa alosa TaxID=278164 RepID=A0AAV6G763_9TELE|nr:hypothetical protein AALO_G00200010 [Alosa alosa]